MRAGKPLIGRVLDALRRLPGAGRLAARHPDLARIERITAERLGNSAAQGRRAAFHLLRSATPFRGRRSAELQKNDRATAYRADLARALREQHRREGADA